MQDKVRLAIVYLLAAEAVPGDSEMNSITDALEAAGASVKALTYVRRFAGRALKPHRAEQSLHSLALSLSAR